MSLAGAVFNHIKWCFDEQELLESHPEAPLGQPALAQSRVGLQWSSQAT